MGWQRDLERERGKGDIGYWILEREWKCGWETGWQLDGERERGGEWETG